MAQAPSSRTAASAVRYFRGKAGTGKLAYMAFGFSAYKRAFERQDVEEWDT
jgi:hypothetical protein